MDLYRRLVRFSEKVLPNGAVNQLRQTIRDYRATRNKNLRLHRENVWAQQQGKGDLVIKLQPRVRMRIYFDSALCRYIYLDEFEAVERRFLNVFLRPGDIFVDVGANVGLFTLIAARLVGPAGKVYSFEPCAETFRRLSDNVRLNRFQNVECQQLALSDVSKTMQFMASTEGLDGWNSFARPYMGDNFSTETATALKWDEWAPAHQLTGRVTMMKIDVEGWEQKVLQGAANELSLPNAPILQVEFTDEAAQSAGTSCRDNYRLLQSFGYEMCIYDPQLNALVADPIREAYPYLNLYAVKNLKAVQARLNG